MSATKKKQDQAEMRGRGVEFVNAAIGKDWNEAIAKAERAETFTQTEHWQAQYRTETARYSGHQAQILEGARSVLDRISTSKTSDEEIDALKQCVKDLTALHGERSVWDARMVAPLRSIAARVKGLKDKALSAAQDAERENPLHEGGLTKDVAAVVARLHSVRREESTGLLIVERADAEALEPTDAA
jgi:hypothetical protein